MWIVCFSANFFGFQEFLGVTFFVVFIGVLADVLVGSLIEFFKTLVKLLGSYVLALLILAMILASLKDPSLASIFILLLIALFGI